MSSESKLFLTTFIISLAFHGVILFQNPRLNIFNKNNKEEKLEISYVKPEEKKRNDEALKPAEKKAEPLLKLPRSVNTVKTFPPPFVEKQDMPKMDKPALSRQPSLLKPDFAKPDIIAIKKKISLPAVGLDKVSSPSYISYYQIVREKIKRAAYQNYTRTEIGEVFISFIISSDGIIREVNLVEEKSSPDSYLQQIALKSVSEVSPFPGFPKELDYPQLSFNVVVSFEVE